ncbi:MAG: decarboxylating 6-phosphogluconate dehydrogenase [Acidimicrobiales bacterium]
MELGMVGLGRMGANIVHRLTRNGHTCVVHDVNPEAVAALADVPGVTATSSLEEFAAALTPPRSAWIMVPAAATAQVVDDVAAHLDAGDVVIDGGNSFYRDAMDHGVRLAERGIDFCDIGTSGGVFGLERGYCLMIGGETAVVERLEPIFDALAPGVEAAPRTPGRAGDPSPAERGWLHCGPVGAGHLVKMVHNGIEYGMMAAYAEGLAILERADLGSAGRTADAETAPLADAGYYRFDIDIPQVAEVWRRGAVIGSWLLDLTAAALVDDPALDGFEGRVSDSGEGRWTAQTAIDLGVPAHVITAALYSRFASRGNDVYGAKVLSAMRNAFGGHLEKSADEGDR